MPAEGPLDGMHRHPGILEPAGHRRRVGMDDVERVDRAHRDAERHLGVSGHDKAPRAKRQTGGFVVCGAVRTAGGDGEVT